MSEPPTHPSQRWKEGALGVRLVQMVDLDAETQPLGTDEHDTEWGPRCYARLPYGFPGYTRLMRRITNYKKGQRSSTDLDGWTYELDLYTFGIKVWIKVDRDPKRVAVFVEDANGRRKVYQSGEQQ